VLVLMVAGPAVLALLGVAVLQQLAVIGFAVVVLVLALLQVARAPCLVLQLGWLLCCCRRHLTVR
jgi:hypothetical protein